MRRLRSTWSRQWIVAVLVTTLAPLVLGPFVDRVADGTDVHARWLRAQVDGAMPDAAQDSFEAALQEARTAGPSRAAFTTAFAKAYVQQSPSVSLSALFDVPSSVEDTLYRALHQRAQQLGSPAAVPLRLAQSSPAPVTTTARMVAAPGTAAVQWMLETTWERVDGRHGAWLSASLMHFLCAVQPLGP
jgi:hypothetical protein